MTSVFANLQITSHSRFRTFNVCRPTPKYVFIQAWALLIGIVCSKWHPRILFWRRNRKQCVWTLGWWSAVRLLAAACLSLRALKHKTFLGNRFLESPWIQTELSCFLSCRVQCSHFSPASSHSRPPAARRGILSGYLNDYKRNIYRQFSFLSSLRLIDYKPYRLITRLRCKRRLDKILDCFFKQVAILMISLNLR